MTEQTEKADALPKFRVSVTVFAEVEAVDERDAGSIVEHAVRTALCNGTPTRRSVVIPARFANATREVRVADVMETGTAAGNGYLWTRPSRKAYRERWGE